MILAGDFFDFLQIGKVEDGKNRASMTVERPEYRELFAALKWFREAADKRVIYLPGNHDAESFWNEEIQETLRERGLVDEFAYYYLASVETGGGRRVVYCEHGNQFDSENSVGDYHDPLDTPLGHHVVMDGTRRIAPYGEISRGLDLSEIKMVYPLVAIPAWIVSRYFYNWAGKAARYLLVPLLVAYAVYKLVGSDLRALPTARRACFSAATASCPTCTRSSGHRPIPAPDTGIFGIFFLVARHAVQDVEGGEPDRRITRPRSLPRTVSRRSSPARKGRRWTPSSILRRPTSSSRGTPIYLRSPRPRGPMVARLCW